MKEYRDEFEVQLMSEVLHVSRSGFYSWLSRDPSSLKKQKRFETKRKIEAIFLDSNKTYGSPRVFEVLKSLGFILSEDTVARYMREMGIYASTKKRFKVITTDSKHNFPLAPNRLEQDFRAGKPNEIWLSDLTYLKTCEGWLYLVSILDLYSRKIIGWSLSTSLAVEGTLAAFKMAVKQQKPGSGIIFHSDRGVQYACEEFRKKLAAHSFIQSMSRKGNCYDNAPMESFFHTFKTEHVYQNNFEAINNRDAMISIFQWIECFYNRKRIHSSIGYKTPIAMEENYVLATAA